MPHYSYRYAVTAALALIVITLLVGQVIGQTEKEQKNSAEVETIMKLRVTASGKTTLFELNNYH